MSNTDLVLYENREAAAVITLNRPEKRNAVNAAMARALRGAVQRASADEAARVVVVTGAGGFFCAGMDLGAFASGEGEGIVSGPGRFAGFVDHDCPKPVIAAVEGFALAGGFEMALACDMVVAGQGAFFGLPEVTVGLFPAAGGAIRLPRLIPARRAVELMLTGERLGAVEAHSLGLVNRLAEDGRVLESALELAGRVAQCAPLGVAATLAVARASLAASGRELWEMNDRAWERVASSRDAAEGPRAFLEKRAPEWSGD